MVTQLADLFPMILLTSLAALLAGPVMIRLSGRLGLLDDPGSAPHKHHQRPTPLVGGPILALALATGIVFLFGAWSRTVVAIVAAAVVMLLWGILDDMLDLRAPIKLAGQLVIATLLISLGVQVQVTRVAGVDLLLSALWYVGLINAFNFVDSMDGLALGLASVASAFFMLVTIDSGQPDLALLSAGILGGCVGLYLYNATPAHLFLGDSGAELLGFLLAAIGVAYVPAGAGLPQGVSWFTPILVLGVPVFDMVLVVVSRLRRGEPLTVGSRDHTYHRLVAMGLDPTRAVISMQLTAIMLGLTAFLALDASVIVANGLFLAIAIAGVGLLVALEKWGASAAVREWLPQSEERRREEEPELAAVDPPDRSPKEELYEPEGWGSD